jgi:hypothetical protein
MSKGPAEPMKEKRRQIRRRPRNVADVVCRKGNLGVGPNLAIRILDVTEEGIRLLVKQPIAPGEETEVNFTPLGCNREVSCEMIAIWCCSQDGHFAVAGKFRKPLKYEDLCQIL